MQISYPLTFYGNHTLLGNEKNIDKISLYIDVNFLLTYSHRGSYMNKQSKDMKELWMNGRYHKPCADKPFNQYDM